MRQSNTSAGVVAAVVPAAGLGRRFGGKARKLFIRLNGRPLLAHTLAALQKSPRIRWIQVVVRPSERGYVRRLIKRFRITKALPPCAGGASRSESVARGCAALPAGARWILIHDGARPCVSIRLIDAAVRAARRHQAVAAGLPAFWTVKEADAAGRVRRTLNRNRLWFVQTPQVFRRDILQKALRKAGSKLSRFPDDASLVEAAGFSVRMILGEALNIKVTLPEDTVMAQSILSRQGGR